MEAGLLVPGTGLLHRWHPLTKLSCIVAAFMVGFAGLWRVGGVPVLAPLLGIGAAALALADGRHTFRVWLKRLFL
ncbi:MAG TPA: hypothetical protein VER55_13480, partial [Ardenticatenaceae bacterium]|nr:hypothetical protein [Ardenticatenaceae bacterium]